MESFANNPHILNATDILLHVVHLSVIFFVMVGWMLPTLRKLHLIIIGIIWFSWIGLGIYVGNIGYCVLTDWQWQIKYALGERGLPLSYPEYIYWRLFDMDINDDLVAFIVAIVLIVSTALSVKVNRKTTKKA